MKKILPITALSTFLTVGCATQVPVGTLLTDIKLPITATSVQGGSKKGEAVCNSYLAVFSTGDCSIESAKLNGGITTVTHMDWNSNNILGLIGTYTLTIYGN